MPVIEISKWDLERLVGKSLSDADIMDLLPRVKCEIDEIRDDKIVYEAPHDRPDLFSVEGLARAIRQYLGIGRNDFVFEDRGVKAYNMGVPKRPYVAFAIVEDLELDDEAISQLFNLQEKLHITYARNRRKASIGLYDLDKIELPVYYELVDPDKTRFVPLGDYRELSLREILSETEKGREYGHLIKDWDKYPVLRDSSGEILSLPPIINAEYNRVTVDTKRVLIDSTGIDPKIVIDMVTIMATSVAERSKTRKIIFVDTIMPDGNVIRAPRSSGPTISLNVAKAEEVLGIKVDIKTAIESLRKMGYSIVGVEESSVTARAPPYRLDVFEWIDLVEDIAMAIGYDVVGNSAISLPPAHHSGRMHPLEYLSRRIRLLMISLGFFEVVNYMMSNPWIQNEVFGDNKPLVVVSNPKMEKYTCLRRWLTPGLLEVIATNIDKKKEMRIFEVGDVAIVDDKSDTGVHIERRLGFAITHPKATLTDSLAVLKTLFDTLGIKTVFEKAKIPGLIPERTAYIKADNIVLGFTGEVDPRILYSLNIMNPVAVSEIILNNLIKLWLT